MLPSNPSWGGPAYDVPRRSGRSHHSAAGTSASRFVSVAAETATAGRCEITPSCSPGAGCEMSFRPPLVFASRSNCSTAAFARRSSAFREKRTSSTKLNARFRRCSRACPAPPSAGQSTGCRVTSGGAAALEQQVGRLALVDLRALDAARRADHLAVLVEQPALRVERHRRRHPRRRRVQPRPARSPPAAAASPAPPRLLRRRERRLDRRADRRGVERRRRLLRLGARRHRGGRGGRGGGRHRVRCWCLCGRVPAVRRAFSRRVRRRPSLRIRWRGAILAATSGAIRSERGERRGGDERGLHGGRRGLAPRSRPPKSVIDAATPPPPPLLRRAAHAPTRHRTPHVWTRILHLDAPCVSFARTAALLAASESQFRPFRRNEVLVSVKAAGVNFPDSLIIRGKYQFQPQFPYSPGGEFSGVVDAVGPDVTSFSSGDRVVGMSIGSYSEKLIPTSRSSPSCRSPWILPPARWSSSRTARCSTRSRTWRSWSAARPCRPRRRRRRTRVGRVGKLMGARVVAVASSEAKLAAAKALGADVCLDYSKCSATARRSSASEGGGRQRLRRCRGSGRRLLQPSPRSEAWAGAGATS